jgi:hypothetical protein
MRLTTKIFVGFTINILFVCNAVSQPFTIHNGGQRTVASKVLNAKVTTEDNKTSREWFARHNLYYKRNWGIDIIGVRPVSSGQMLTFRYSVLDAEKAKPLFDKTAKPFVIDEATGTRLAVPAMENVGELRQSTLLDTNRNYFIVFGNPGKVVKSGSKVSIVIGSFRIDDLIVD